MKVENVPEFTRRFEDYVTSHILPEQTSATINIDAQLDFRDITPKFFFDLKKFNPFGPDNHKPVFATLNVYDYGTSKVVGRDQEHIKLELVDNKSNNVMNGIAFGQSHRPGISRPNSLSISVTPLKKIPTSAGKSSYRLKTSNRAARKHGLSGHTEAILGL